MTARRRAARGQLFVSGLLFGLMAVVARHASRGEGGFTAAQLTAVRFGVGAALTLAVFMARPGTFRPGRLDLLCVRGVCGGLAVLLYFVALARIPAGEATLLNNTFPVFAVLLAIFLLRERPTAHLALALLLVTAGVALVMEPRPVARGLGPGQLAALLSAAFGGAAVVAVRALRSTHNAPTIFFSFCVGGLAVSLPFAAGPWPASPWPWTLAAGIGVLSFVAQLLMTHAYGALTVPEAAIWQQLTPVASFGWALALLGERLSSRSAAGIVVVGVGVACGSAFGHRPDAAAPAPAGRRPAEPPVEPVEPA